MRPTPGRQAFQVEDLGDRQAVSRDMALVKVAYGIARQPTTDFATKLRGGTRAMGIADPSTARPPAPGSPPLFERAWQEFCCRSLAESFQAMVKAAQERVKELLASDRAALGKLIGA